MPHNFELCAHVYPCASTSQLLTSLLALSAALVVGCHAQTPSQKAGASEQVAAVAEAPPAPPRDYGEFQLKAEAQVACDAKSEVDVNLGNAPEKFVRDAYCQINGKEPPTALVSQWSD